MLRYCYEVLKSYFKCYVKDEAGLTPLMYAARSGRTESAKILLKRGAQLQARDLKGLTALHHAARNYQPKFIKMIIKQGMPVDIKDKKQLTAMHHAISGRIFEHECFHHQRNC